MIRQVLQPYVFFIVAVYCRKLDDLVQVNDAVYKKPFCRDLSGWRM